MSSQFERSSNDVSRYPPSPSEISEEEEEVVQILQSQLSPVDAPNKKPRLASRFNSISDETSDSEYESSDLEDDEEEKPSESNKVLWSVFKEEQQNFLREKAPSTRDNYTRYMKRVNGFLSSRVSGKYLTVEDFKALNVWINRDTRAETTRKTVLGCMRSYMEFFNKPELAGCFYFTDLEGNKVPSKYRLSIKPSKRVIPLEETESEDDTQEDEEADEDMDNDEVPPLERKLHLLPISEEEVAAIREEEEKKFTEEERKAIRDEEIAAFSRQEALERIREKIRQELREEARMKVRSELRNNSQWFTSPHSSSSKKRRSEEISEE